MPKTSFICILSLIACLTFMTGCSNLGGDVREALYPTDTPQPATQHTPIAEAPAQQATATAEISPTHTPAGNTVVNPSPTPASDKGQQLVFVQDETLYRGGYLGETPVQAGTIPQLESWDLRAGHLALASTVDLLLIDLGRGSLANPEWPVADETLYSQVLWSTSGNSVVLAITQLDEQAPTYGRRVELLSYSADGSPLNRTTLYDLMGVQLLRYDDSLAQITLVPLADEGNLLQVESYDLGTGNRLQARPIAGQGEARISPDGHYLLTTVSGKNETAFQIYDLQAEGQVRPRVWEHADGALALSPIWAPDSSSLAYLLVNRDETSTEGEGVWLLNLDTMRASSVIAETSSASSLVGWTPDGAYLVGYHHGDQGGSYYYAVRSDGGGRQILGVDAQASLLGWMAAPQTQVPQVIIDPWKHRFLEVGQAPEETMALIAAYVEQASDRTAETLESEIAGYLGAQDDLAAHLVQIGSGTFLLEWSSSIHLLQAGQVQAISPGHIVEARRQDDKVGLILAIDVMGTRQQAFMLLQQTEQAVWRVAWMPQGYSDWITTDGEIQFEGEGLDTLTVRGSSFGLDIGEDEVFVECHDCPHRAFVATWRAEGDAYVRDTQLSAEAPRYEVYWEMTEPSAYAVTYEALRRMRQELPLDQVIDRPSVIEQANNLGLLDPQLRLRVDRIEKERVLFGNLEETEQFVAEIQDGRLARLTRR